MDRDCGAATVVRAQTGDQHATNELIGGHLPLVYNIVGRALGGHPDTDDVVQETMLRAVDSLPSLREPASFRSWLVAIAMNQIRRRHQDRLAQRAHQAAAAGGLGPQDAYEPVDPGADFVGLTIIRLGLAGQRREVAEATRWLDETDRELLSLWWLEAAGELTRPELAAAMELSPQHTAVRVQRMKGQLETARVVVRALATTPPCPELAELTAAWDGVPGALWRKRIARHARDCGHCARHWSDLVPAEGLLAGLALVPLPRAHAAAQHAAALTASHAPIPPAGSPSPATARHRARPGSGGHRRRPKPQRRVLATALGTAVLTVVAAGIVFDGEKSPFSLIERTDSTAEAAPVPLTLTVATTPPAAAPVKTAVATTSAPPSPTPSATATPSPAQPSTSAPVRSPSASATTAPAPAPAAARPSPPAGVQQQVLNLVNTERAKAGCGPVRTNSKLQAAAQGHSDDMAARNFFDHTNPDGKGPQQRIEAAGYQWSTWGENIARGQSDAVNVMDSWMNSPGHKANILNCAFTELGVGVHQGTGGPWWTQDFGTPA